MNIPQASDQIIQVILRVPSSKSAFAYFLLESNEGVTFYSTLDHAEDQGFRDLEINSSISMIKEFEHLIGEIINKCSAICIAKNKLFDQ